MNAIAQPSTAAGLYDPAFEHDACGVAFVARLDREPTHDVVDRGLLAIEHLFHRGATGADPETGDGAGLLLGIPDALLRAAVPFELPPLGAYGVAVVFFPPEDARREELERTWEEAVHGEGQHVLGWRDVPISPEHCGRTARGSMPRIRQLFIGAEGPLASDQDAFERKLYVIRRAAERHGGPDLVVPSCSSRTIVYKGMLTSLQLRHFYPDLADPRCASQVALGHSRFSTNTFPSWELAHPYRMIAHNGEINTLMGNRNWMRAREKQLASELWGDDLPKVLPSIRPGGSDSATFDNVLELLTLSGRSVPHAMMMMIPEAWEDRDDMPEELRGFYAYHSCLMEPWDGPAAVAFTDGRVVGATLDRNGLRPGRWVETSDGYVVLASESGVLPMPEETILRKGRLQPGNLFLVDLEQGRIVEDTEIKRTVSTRRPYGEWYTQQAVHFDELPRAEPTIPRTEPLHRRQLVFGYSQEDLRVLLAPMAQTGAEPTGSMGNDLALAVLSDKSPSLFSYFKQLFAQVTNPAIDPIRESIVMSLASGVGAERNLFEETPEHARQLVMRQPILTNAELEKLRHVPGDVFPAETIDITWPVMEGAPGMAGALQRVCTEASKCVGERGAAVIVLSDRRVGPGRAPIPSLLAVAAVHHHLVREGTRLRAGLVIESGEPREIHHMACLIGYGAAAVNPYVMLEGLGDLHRHGELPEGLSIDDAERNVIKAIGKGLLKVMSKMGISTIQSYCGAQIFEAVGLDHEVIDTCFTGTARSGLPAPSA